jgi:1-aminocyclopropane-1-carboxylate deaminase
VLNIPEGGGGYTGELGMEAVIEDLLVGPWNLKMELSKEKQHPVLHLITSVGTGSSLRGLLNGIQKQQLPIKAHGIVVLKGAEEMANDFSMFDSNNYELHHQFHGGGYGKINQETKDCIKEFASQTGILLDPIYEAKMMIGITTLINENYFEPGAQICALHNGGLVGLLSGKV